VNAGAPPACSGAVLSVVTSYLLYTNSAAFGTLSGPFPVSWLQIALIVGVTFVVSIAATLPPANRAAAFRPALAVRVSD
jgi:putative ABC transport system permease protein